MNQQKQSNNFKKALKSQVKSALRSKLAQRLSYPHGVDRYLEYVNPAWSIDQVRATVVRKCTQTDDTISLFLRPNSNWTGFKPGQYLRFTVSIDGSLRTRCFSPAQSLHTPDGLIEITAKLHDQAYVPRYMRDQLALGDVVTLSQADGQFALPDQRPQRVVLISGGSGITPVMSMLRTLIDEDYSGEISFLHYCNTPKDQLYADELNAIAESYPNVDVQRCYANDASAGELHGLFTAKQLSKVVPDLAGAQSFLCGPPGLMQAVESTFAKRGLSEQLHLERFSAAPVAVESSNTEGDVRFARSERIAGNNGDTLLDQAEAAGLKPNSGCRMGVCYACTCRKTSGQVLDTRTGQISSSDEQDIQICVSVPVGSVTLDI
ncbi:MAG: ferredoxin reductase [Oceanococcus sp.]